MPRADSLGLNYALPENRYLTVPEEQGPVAPEQAPSLDLPKNEVGGLAWAEGITDKFYDLRGKIEKYAVDMQKKYGIDVTQPDYTSPGGGLPFKTYQKMATDLMVTANDLKNSYARDTADEAGVRAGTFVRGQGYDPTKQLSSRTPIEQRGFATDLLPEVTQANHILQTNVHTDADYNRFKTQVLNPIVARLTKQKAQASPVEQEYIQRNIDALVQQPKTTPYAAFQGQYGNGKKQTVEIDILRDTTNLAQGRWPEGTYSKATDSDGNPILINKKREGEQYGEYVFTDPKTQQQKRIPRIIDRWVKKPDGSISLEFKKGDGGEEIPAEKVSDKRGDAVTSNLIASNPKYGSVSNMYSAARELGYTDDTGSVRNEPLLGDAQTPDLAKEQAAVEAEKQRILSEVRALPVKFVGERPSVLLRSKDGDQVMVKKGVTGKFYIEVIPKDQVDFIKRLGGYKPGDEKRVKGREIKSGLSEDQLMEYLTKEITGYYDQFLDEGETPQQSTEKLPNETQAQYDLRMIRMRRSKQK